MIDFKKITQIGTIILSMYTFNSNAHAEDLRKYIPFTAQPVSSELSQGQLEMKLNYNGQEVFASTHAGNKSWDQEFHDHYKQTSLEFASKIINNEINDSDNDPLTLMGYWWSANDKHKFIIEGIKTNNETYLLVKK